MEKTMMRLAFCLMPALIAGAACTLFGIEFGGFVFVAVFAFGLDITKARLERGEF
jgi:hypothetical protein